MGRVTALSVCPQTSALSPFPDVSCMFSGDAELVLPWRRRHDVMPLSSKFLFACSHALSFKHSYDPFRDVIMCLGRSQSQSKE